MNHNPLFVFLFKLSTYLKFDLPMGMDVKTKNRLKLSNTQEQETKFLCL